MNIDHSAKFIPRPTAETQHYWDGCAEGELRFQLCLSCGHRQLYPRLICTQCMGRELGWQAASGSGEIVSFSIVRRAVSSAYAPELPYVVALIKLTEGPTLMSNVVDCDVASVVVGQAVELLFESWTEDISVPKFRPVD